jgi:hypothetical protein
LTVDLFEFLRNDKEKTIESKDIARMIREMSDDINDIEMKIILDQTFSTFDLIPGDSVTEDIFIDVN